MSPEAHKPTVAIFDLDGTLTWRDTLVPFLAEYVAARPRRLARLWRLPGALLAYAGSGADRGVLKARLIRMALGTDPRGDIDAWAQDFVAAMPARGYFRPAALAALEAHRRAGDRLVLLSASPDLYVPHIGRLLGFAQTICTEVGWRGDRLDGTLRSANRLGAEKLRVLESLRRQYAGQRVVAYGNSADDLVHLCQADQALLVNAGRSARARARQLGLATSDWR
jgi:phosphatidylglycerophosphatase C